VGNLERAIWDSEEASLGIWVQSPERQFSQRGGPHIKRGGKHITGHLPIRYLSRRPHFESYLWKELPDLVRESLREAELLRSLSLRTSGANLTNCWAVCLRKKKAGT